MSPQHHHEQGAREIGCDRGRSCSVGVELVAHTFEHEAHSLRIRQIRRAQHDDVGERCYQQALGRRIEIQPAAYELGIGRYANAGLAADRIPVLGRRAGMPAG
jgi:hypothetical protein